MSRFNFPLIFFSFILFINAGVAVAFEKKKQPPAETNTKPDSCGKIKLQPAKLLEYLENNCKFVCHSSIKFPIYQWQQNEGKGFVNINDFGPFTGTKTETLSVFASSYSLSGTQYRCIITNDKGCADTSAPATLTLNAPNIETVTADRIIINPNPVREMCSVVLPNRLENGTLELFDKLGQLIIQKPLRSSLTYVEFSKVPNGIYTAKITVDGQSYYKELKIQHDPKTE